jgi:hypothetical protein|tara:strand:+ start:264 stop:1835 length:1572 start_codon:yes stop_codon:yes gene_type:complete
MATQKVNIDISTRGATKSKEELSGLNGAITKMGKAVGVASAAYFGAKGLIAGFSRTIELAGIQEQAEKKLTFALGGNSRALLEQASALQKVSTFGDEAIIQQQAFLASLEFSEDQIKSIIPVAMDLASATGISLESAVRNTAKTFSGLAGELGELVPQLRGLTAEQMKSGEAVKVLGELFEGQANVQAETLTGTLMQMENAVGDAGEAIGELLSPAVIKIAQAMQSFAENTVDFIEFLDGVDESDEILDNFNKRTEEAEGVIKKFSEELGITVDTTKPMQEQLKSLGEQANELKGNFFLQGRAFNPATEASVQANQALTAYTQALELFKTTAEPMVDRPFVPISSHDAEMLDDVIIDMGIMNDLMEESFELSKASQNQKKEQMILDMKSAALSQKSAKDTMKAIVRAETMEAIAGYISSVFKTVPFPFNLAAAAGAGLIVSSAIDKELARFATGGDFITSGPQMIMVGDNPGGRERVQVTPLSSPNINGPQGVTINLRGNILGTREFVRDTLVPEIQKAVRYS